MYAWNRAFWVHSHRHERCRSPECGNFNLKSRRSGSPIPTFWFSSSPCINYNYTMDCSRGSPIRGRTWVPTSLTKRSLSKTSSLTWASFTPLQRLKSYHGHNGEPPKGSYCTPQIQVVVLIQAAPGPSSFKIKENISTEHEIDIDLKKESVNLMSVPDTCVQ
jgi:hypothetical protein